MSADLQTLRDVLVEQVRQNARTPISDEVAGVLRAVPRHLFLPAVPAAAAYQDEAIATKLNADGLPISSSSQPTIMALMLDQLALRPGHRVLEIGAGTGYNAALMSRLVSPGGEVVSVDIDQDLVDTARANLDRAGFPAVRVVRADGVEGHAARAPYDRIIATVGVWDLAPAWLEQLAPDGRVVVPLDLGGTQGSVAFEREGARWVSRSVVPAAFMRLRGTLSGPERTHLLDRERLFIMVPDGGDIDRSALLAAWERAPCRRLTGVTSTAHQLFGGVGLWLALNQSRWCVVSESSSASRPHLLAAPLQFTDRRYTAGLLDGDSIAVLAVGAGDGPDRQIVALGYGPAGDALATRLAAAVRDWDAAGKPGIEGLHIEAYPKSTPDNELPDRLVLRRRHTMFALSWPDRA